MAIQDMHPYWLFTWLESHRIKTISDAATALSRRSTLRELRDVAGLWSESAEGPPSGLNLVAGSGIRLDSEDVLSCSSASCRRRQVDVLFRHAWHYFDRILLPDGAADLLLKPPSEWSVQYQQEVLLGFVDIALHIQQLGANRLVHYYPSIRTSSPVLGEVLADRHEQWEAAWHDVEATLLAKADYKSERIGQRKFLVNVSDPLLEVAASFKFELNQDDPEGTDFLRAAAAHEVLHQHIAQLENDLVTARQLRGSLASTVWSHEHVLSHLSKAPDSSNVLFHISFPTLENVPINELIAIRHAEGDAFLAFRNALARAAKEMASNNEASEPQAVAAQILRDVVDPELAKLRTRLRAAQWALAGKCAVSIGLAALGTLCGLQWAALPAAAAIAGVNSAVSKYIDENQAIEISDMFFLWKALKHAE